MRTDMLASGERDRVAVAMGIVPLTTPINCISIFTHGKHPVHRVSAQYSKKQGVMEERPRALAQENTVYALYRNACAHTWLDIEICL